MTEVFWSLLIKAHYCYCETFENQWDKYMNIFSLTVKIPWDIHVYIFVRIKVHYENTVLTCDCKIFYNKEVKPSTWTLISVIKSTAYSNMIAMKKHFLWGGKIITDKHKCSPITDDLTNVNTELAFGEDWIIKLWV